MIAVPSIALFALQSMILLSFLRVLGLVSFMMPALQYSAWANQRPVPVLQIICKSGYK